MRWQHCALLVALTLLGVRGTASARPTESPEARYQSFTRDFQELSKNCAPSQAASFMNKYSPFVSTRGDLHRLRQQRFYRPTMARLVRSQSPHERLLAYVTLAAVGDSSYNFDLRRAARHEKLGTLRFWAGIPLLLTADPHTGELFDFVLANDSRQDPHLLEIYLCLDPESLRQTAFEKIHSSNPEARILAIQSLEHASPHPETELLVKAAVLHWPHELKGYAIAMLGVLRLPGQKALLQPWLSDPELRAVCLGALAQSPTLEDQAFLDSLAGQSAELDADLISAYLETQRPDAARKGLVLLRGRPMPADHFLSHRRDLLTSDDLLVDVQQTVRLSQEVSVLYELAGMLGGRRDEVSLTLLRGLLQHPDPEVRKCAIQALTLVIGQLPHLVRSPATRSLVLAQLAIDNQVELLRDVFLPYWTPGPHPDPAWRRTALTYLVAFPQVDEDLPLFRSILENEEEASIRRLAAEGLGKLRDGESVDLILDAMQADQVAQPYLEALAKIGDARCLEILQEYRPGPAPRVHL